MLLGELKKEAPQDTSTRSRNPSNSMIKNLNIEGMFRKIKIILEILTSKGE